MSRKRLKARDKIALKMSRDGAVEKNLASGEDIRISKRSADFDLREQSADGESFSQFGKSHEPDHKSKRRQSRPAPAENSAAGARAEPQTVHEKDGAPNQPDITAVSRTTDADELHAAWQSESARTSYGGSFEAGGHLTGSGERKQQLPEEQYQSITADKRLGGVGEQPDAVPDSALKHEKPDSPLKSEPLSGLRFTHEDTTTPSRTSKKKNNSQAYQQRDTAAPSAKSRDSPPEPTQIKESEPLIPAPDGTNPMDNQFAAVEPLPQSSFNTLPHTRFHTEPHSGLNFEEHGQSAPAFVNPEQIKPTFNKQEQPVTETSPEHYSGDALSAETGETELRQHHSGIKSLFS